MGMQVDRYEEYPKMRELTQRKDDLVAKRATPPYYLNVSCFLFGKKPSILDPEIRNIIYLGFKFTVYTTYRIQTLDTKSCTAFGMPWLLGSRRHRTEQDSFLAFYHCAAYWHNDRKKCKY